MEGLLTRGLESEGVAHPSCSTANPGAEHGAEWGQGVSHTVSPEQGWGRGP